ncbi:hypothetical protein B0I37DRAFT_73886 [Chaetomium sp. MPI-CAGE-AT-0009]|nr:hypothetical protein B0I37DRAFT_73886 [Chaetomium sp. MPI-CAGE-AT-0009]
MAQPPSRSMTPRPTSLPTPSTPFTSSPLTPTGKPRLGPRIQSRFTEDMSERTPAASISERSMDYYWYGRSAEDVNTNANTNHTNNTNTFPAPDAEIPPTETEGRDRSMWLRLANGALHVVPCLVLLGIFAYAMRVLREDMGSYMSIEAIILICFLCTDVALDAMTFFRAKKPWPTWGLGLRCTCGIAYFALFLIYIGLGDPFPQNYTYWGLPTRFAALVVYILLCVEGLWNLLHLPFTRYQLGSALLGRATARAPPPPPSPSPTLTNNRTSFNPRFSAADTEHSSISLTWRRWVRTRSTQCSSRDDDLEPAFLVHGAAAAATAGAAGAGPGREPSVDGTLRERPGEGAEADPRVKGEAGSSRVPSSLAGKLEEASGCGKEGVGCGKEGGKWCDEKPEGPRGPPR